MGVDVGEKLNRRPAAVDRPALIGQVALGLGLFGLYLLVDATGGAGRRAAAVEHGRAIFDLERRLHLDVERTLNDWLAPHSVLSTLANYEYATTYILSAVALLVWVWIHRPEQWRFARDSFLVLNLLSFATFLLYPTAPPRMLTGLGFVDTVSRGHTVGSWGSGLVDTANQVAAMPSLHIGWALWVSVVLARFTVGLRVQLISAVHVLLTLFVVMATANHYLLDAVAVVVPILAGIWYAHWRYDGPPGEVVASCDAFFLHVEATGAAQHVGGLVALGVSPTGRQPTPEDVRRLATERLVPLPRFGHRLVTTSRWRRPRWVETRVDVDQHVSERYAGGPHGLRVAVARLAEEALPRDRPLWRLVLVHGAVDGVPTSAVVVIVHHAVADGVGTIISAMRLFDPLVPLPVASGKGPGPIRRGAAVALGLAQLATDGGARSLGPGTPSRDFGIAVVPFDVVRRAARNRGVRVTDLVIAATVDAVRTVAPDLAERAGGHLKVSVPLLVRAPSAAPQGNATAAIILDAPTRGSFDDVLADVLRRSRRLRRPTRALASRFVMATGLRLLPEPAAEWFARTVYGARFLHLVVSNLPGPAEELTMLGRPTVGTYPILPLAPGTPLAMGALTWGGAFGIGLATDPVMLDAQAVVDALRDRLADLADEAPSASPLQGQEQPSA
ncbi:MAG TPA: phosphatase PAP2 family protein [Nocardioides sp.]|uniref:bifunctional phosphatase PAP2/O-acyltransferase family protein n=1 Tax=Nocardioides sp. TaxID=35761 RepID=UPI002F3FABD2